MSDLRMAAWSVLRSGSDTPLRLVDVEAERFGLDARDRGLLRRLIGTEVRRRGSLRAIVRAFAHFKPKPDLVAHLHLGLVQILFLDRVPDHAAVSETASAVHRTLGPSKVKYANAILRSVIRARREGASGDPRRDLVGRNLQLGRAVFRDPTEHPLLWMEDALSLPAPIAKRWQRRHGEEATRELARLALSEPHLSLRVVRGERDGLRAELEASGPMDGGHPDVLLFEPGAAEAVLASSAFAEGRATVQGESALRAAELVGAAEGERILEMCAAPGGKTAVLAAAGARVLACDIDPGRLEAVQEGLGRLGLSEGVECRAGDGAAPAGEEMFDAALVDAPCSNTGVLGARPGARWRFGPASLRSLEEVQGRLLSEAADRVRPGGRLVWSTCSLEPEENRQRVSAFLAGRDDWELEEEREAVPAGPPGPVDGGYACRLRRARG